MEQSEILIPAGPQPTRLTIGSGLTEMIIKELKERYPGCRFALISDRRVAARWSAPLREALAAGLYTFPSGERSKSRRQKEKLEDRLLRDGFGRDTVVLALGGGVTGDLAGFVAATYMRGVPVVQLPTTTLAMADASIGGKTAVNTPRGKNLIGAFHQPDAVYMDLQTLTTLSDRDYRAGLVEAVKMGMIADTVILTEAEERADGLRTRQADALEILLSRSCKAKAAFVQRDPEEAGERAMLNYGHTFGHAVEHAMHGRLRHGECVALGIRLAAGIMEQREPATVSWARRQNALLDALDMPRRLPHGLTEEKLLQGMRQDKKTRAGQIRMVLSPEPGVGRYDIPVAEEELRAAIRKIF